MYRLHKHTVFLLLLIYVFVIICLICGKSLAAFSLYAKLSYLFPELNSVFNAQTWDQCVCCCTFFSSVCLLTLLILLLLSVLLPSLLLCGFVGIEHVTNILHAMCVHWNETSSCFLSFRVSQTPMNVHLIILFRERQACQALVWWWECCSFDF